MQRNPSLKKYAVTVEGGWLSIVSAADRREAERRVRRGWNEMQGKNVYPEVRARLATEEDLAWHRAMGGHG